jgi:hypothetical protein
MSWFFKGSPKFLLNKDMDQISTWWTTNTKINIAYHFTYMYEMKCKTKSNCWYFLSIIPTENFCLINLHVPAEKDEYH